MAYFEGTAENDILDGSWADEADTILGLDGDDVLNGLGGNDELDGGTGDDSLTGGAGADVLDGGEGTDTARYAGSAAAVVIDLAAGTASGGDAAGDQLFQIENLTGSDWNDQLTGNGASNLLIGGSGNDTLVGGSGDDSLLGGAGADVLDGGTGIDSISYADSPAGFPVTINLATGLAQGGMAAGDVLIGIENVTGTWSSDILTGNAAANILAGSNGNDVLDGGAGNDRLEGGVGVDTLTGGEGDDVIDGDFGADAINGGAGSDTVSYVNSIGNVLVDLSAGHGGGFYDDTGDTYQGIENVVGSAYGDEITGDAAANRLEGGADADLLAGGDGDDVLCGGAGFDALDGGAGFDTADYGTSIAGVFVYLAGGTNSGGEAAGDTLTGIEGLIGSRYDDTLRGDALANRLQGGNGHDSLYGDAGNDILEGGDGLDALTGGLGADILDGGAGGDAVHYFGSASGVTIDLAAGTGSGGEAQGDILRNIEHLYGSHWNDRLTGSTDDNYIFGDSGDDVIEGGSGLDSLAGGDGDDVLRGGAGADAIEGGAGIDTASYYSGATGVLVSLASGAGSGGEAQGDTLSGIENLSGSQGGDSLYGNAGANMLQGWNGNDLLVGRAGQDTLAGGAGADRFQFAAVGDSVVGTNADVVTDFSHAQGDRIDLAGIDANAAAAGDQAFSFIGAGLYTGVAGQLRFAVTAPGVTTVAGDVNGDKVSDFHIQLTGAIALVAVDFVL